MSEFLALILENPPLSRLAEGLAAALRLFVRVVDPAGNTLAKAGDFSGGSAAEIPLVWQGRAVGALQIDGAYDLPEVVTAAFAAKVHSRRGREHAVEARLISALRNREGDADPPETAGAFLLFYTDANALDESRWQAFFSALTAVCDTGISAAAFYDGVAALLFRREDCRTDAICPALSAILRKYGLSGALSQPFDGCRLTRQLELTRLTIAAGSRLYPEQHLYRFEELASFVFFLMIQRNMPLGRYHNEDVLRIIHQDYEKGSDLSRSLYLYLFYFMDLKSAAQAMQIHRNTLDYQIKKIVQLLGHPPDQDKRFQMMCTYGMLAMEQPD